MLKAFKMFKDGRPLEDVAIEMDIESPTVICYYEDLPKISEYGKTGYIYNEVKEDPPLFLRLYGRIKIRDLVYSK